MHMYTHQHIRTCTRVYKNKHRCECVLCVLCVWGFGVVLEQEGDDQKMYPIAYASRQTNPAEQKHAPTKLEVAALVFAVDQ